MKRGSTPKGFTIVETMIFLAVTSAILVSALSLIGGSQNQAQFTAALNDANEQITKVVNNVANGYYPNSFRTCANTAGPTLAIGAPNPADPDIGTKSECVYLGRVIEFSDQESFQVFNIVGLRETAPRVVNTSMATSKATALGDSETINLKNGLTVERITIGTAPQNYGSVGFFTSLGDTDVSNQLVSGGLSADFIALENGLPNNVANIPAIVQSPGFRTTYDTTTARNPFDGVRICFRSGTTDQVGILTIGGQGRNAVTTLIVQEDCI